MYYENKSEVDGTVEAWSESVELSEKGFKAWSELKIETWSF